MDKLNHYRDIVENVLVNLTLVPYAYGDIHTETVFDRVHDHYLLVDVGWHDDRRIHGSIAHLDIINEKVWVQYDGTEHGIANDLVEAGIPKDDIVLGFRPQEIRQYTEFAIA